LPDSKRTPGLSEPSEQDDAYDILPLGSVLDGKYLIEGHLGHGGMCFVLQAKRMQLQDRVAIKVLRRRFAQDQELLARFLQEGRSISRLKSEHVVRVFDDGTTPDGVPYLVFELLEGSDLDTLVATKGPLPVPDAIECALQATMALAEAHSRGIIHRDVKPSNLFLTRRTDGTIFIKVIDFGISKLADAQLVATDAESVLGSPRYMAPEQVRATREVDARSDIWAMGSTLFELLSGETPFEADTLPELWAATLRDPPRSLRELCPECPKELELVIRRCLRRDPARRFATMADLAAALAPFGYPRGASLTEPPPPGVLSFAPAKTIAPSAAPTSRFTVLAVSAALVLSAVLGAYLLVARHVEHEDEEEDAPQPAERTVTPAPTPLVTPDDAGAPTADSAAPSTRMPQRPAPSTRKRPADPSAFDYDSFGPRK